MYKDWARRFYPEDLKDAEKLAYFADHFSTVEVNSTFYHMPTKKSVIHWRDATPDNFVFSIKMYGYLTHRKKLIIDEDSSRILQNFLRTIANISPKLGAILIQLPSNLHKDLPRLKKFIGEINEYEKILKTGFQLAVEFRHKSWFSADVFEFLKQQNIANVIIDSPGRWPANRTITSGFLYLRFHGSKWIYRSSYTNNELKRWADFISKHKERSIFAYFNNDHNAAAVKNAQKLQELLQ